MLLKKSEYHAKQRHTFSHFIVALKKSLKVGLKASLKASIIQTRTTKVTVVDD